MRELLKDLDGALSNATSSSDTKDHGCEFPWHAASTDVISEPAQSVFHRVVVQIHVRAANEEWRLVLFLKQEFSNTAKEIKCTSDASISTEGHKAFWELAFALWFPDALEVDHANIELLELVQQGHVVVLRLDRVREEEVCLVG